MHIKTFMQVEISLMLSSFCDRAGLLQPQNYAERGIIIATPR